MAMLVQSANTVLICVKLYLTWCKGLPRGLGHSSGPKGGPSCGRRLQYKTIG